MLNQHYKVAPLNSTTQDILMTRVNLTCGQYSMATRVLAKNVVMTCVQVLVCSSSLSEYIISNIDLESKKKNCEVI